MNGQHLWLTFQADTSYLFLGAVTSDSIPNSSDFSVQILSGTCTNLNLIATVNEGEEIDTNCFLTGNYYLIHIHKSSNNNEWIGLQLGDAPLGPPYELCASTASTNNCCNQNGCFLIQICQDESVDFTISNDLYSDVGPYYVYEFDPSGLPYVSSPVMTSSGIQVPYTTSFTIPGTYFIKVTYSNGATEFGNFEILVKPKPNLIASGNNACEGEIISLNATPAGLNYQWTGPTGSNFSSQLQSPQLTATMSAAGIYTVTATNSYGCSSQANVNIVVYPTNQGPGLTIIGNINNCDITSVYTASIQDPNAYYTWSTNCGANTCAIFNPTAASGIGLFTVTVTWINTNLPALQNPVTLTCSAIGNGCEESLGELTIYKCCYEEGLQLTPLINYNIVQSTIYPSGTKLDIEGILNIYADVTIEGSSEIYLGAMAKIVVHDNVTLTVKGSVKIQQMCHYHMWDGIYATGTTSKIVFKSDATGSPIVEDAINGIVSLNGGSLNITSTEFNENYCGIKILDYGPGIPGYNGTINLEIAGNIFTNVVSGSVYPHRLVYYPYAGQLPMAGIYVNNVDELVIGTDNVNANIFSYLPTGIWSETSSITVRNSIFDHMPGPDEVLYSWPPQQAAIVATGPPLSIESPFIPALFIDGSANGNVIITNSLYGVVAQRTKAYVNDLKTIDCNNAIHLMDIRYPTTITDCEIKKSSTQINPDFPGTAISVLNSLVTTDPCLNKLLITNNTIKGIGNGIHCIQQNALFPIKYSENLICLNSIDFENELSGESQARHGILTEACDGIKIISNLVTGYEGFFIEEDLRGIRITRSNSAWVSHNTLTALKSGIYTNGELFNTYFPCNTFGFCYSGFYFGPFTAMSDQYLLNLDPDPSIYPLNNTFIGGFIPSVPNYHRMRQDVPKENIINTFTWHYNPATHPMDPLWMQYNFSHTCYPDIYPQQTDLIDLCNNTEVNCEYCTHDTAFREKYFGALARGEITFTNLVSQNQFYGKDYLYTTLLKNPELLLMGGVDDSLYTNLYDSLKSTDAGLIQQVYEMLRQGKVDSAAYLNNLIPLVGEWIDNRKSANSLYLQTWGIGDYFINSNDSTQGAQVALQTPYNGGDGVYTYRVLLNMIDPESYGTPYRTLVKVDEYSKLKVWPNPASEIAYLEVKGDQDQPYLVDVFNFTGIQVDVIEPKSIENRLQINTGRFKNGCYILRAHSLNGTIYYGKLCIIR
jgi:hypothetical protein